MFRSIKLLAYCGLFIYFLFLVLSRAPVELVVATLNKAVPNLELYGVKGDFWEGRAAGSRVKLGQSSIDLGPARWSIDAKSLLLLKICASVSTTKVSTDACRTLTGSNVLSNLQVDLPVSLANDWVPEANFSGESSLLVERVALNDKGEIHQLKGNLRWSSARVQVQRNWIVLGDFAADLTHTGNGGINAEIIDLAGPFKVKLNASVEHDLQPKIKGEIQPKPNEVPDYVVDALAGFTEADFDTGIYKVTYPFGS